MRSKWIAVGILAAAAAACAPEEREFDTMDEPDVWTEERVTPAPPAPPLDTIPRDTPMR